jgi:16S rRNA (guanine966-N2)-methyltransferase
MRIIAGDLRHRVLASPSGFELTRPMPDRVRESLFSILREHCDGASVFDAFAGVGTIGLECISRGAVRVVMVEQDRRVAEFLRRNVEALKVEDRTELVVGDALGAGALARCPRPVHLAFFDPPYSLVREGVGFARVMAQLSRVIDLLDDTGFAVLRTPWPLWLADGPPVPTAVEPARGFRRRKVPRDQWKRDLLRAEHTRLDRKGGTWQPREEPVGEIDIGAQPLPARRAADLTLPNAVGPETHRYRGMAVHLYMKKR